MGAVAAGLSLAAPTSQLCLTGADLQPGISPENRALQGLMGLAFKKKYSFALKLSFRARVTGMNNGARE